ncbi:hydroxypyruvate isomerase, partial [Mycobacterium tuberculosis]|nr:hydroxypyruvate isomerase [Mycobacterium tuberculosis]
LFTEWPLLDRFQAAADAGFADVELHFPYDTDPDQLARAAAAAGVTITLFFSPPGRLDLGERGLAALPHRAESFRDSLALGLRYA